MEIRNLLSFVQVAELNSFTKAAKLLGYSQSTVSFQIKQLEEELGCLLFERINHTISLTEKGKELLAYAQKISVMTEEFNQNIHAFRPLSASLHILAPDSVCEDMMLRNYSEFHKKYPGISLKFTTADTLEMFRMIDHNLADVMLTLDEHRFQRDYVIEKEEPVPMRFVTGANSPYAARKRLSLCELVELPFILTEKNAGYRRAFDNLLAERSLEISPMLEIGRTDVIASVLEKGVGVSCLPEFVVKEKHNQGKLVYIEVEDCRLDIWKQLICHKNKWRSKSLEALIEFIKENEFSS